MFFRAIFLHEFLQQFKVEKFLKGSLDSIPSPSPSVKFQIMGGKVCLGCKGKTLLDVVNKLLKTKSLLTFTQQCFALLPQLNFTANNLNFHWRWRWWDRIQAIFLNLFYFSIRSMYLNDSYYSIKSFVHCNHPAIGSGTDDIYHFLHTFLQGGWIGG